jgi:hypothetical protein
MALTTRRNRPRVSRTAGSDSSVSDRLDHGVQDAEQQRDEEEPQPGVTLEVEVEAVQELDGRPTARPR